MCPFERSNARAETKPRARRSEQWTAHAHSHARTGTHARSHTHNNSILKSSVGCVRRCWPAGWLRWLRWLRLSHLVGGCAVAVAANSRQLARRHRATDCSREPPSARRARALNKVVRVSAHAHAHTRLSTGDGARMRVSMCVFSGARASFRKARESLECHQASTSSSSSCADCTHTLSFARNARRCRSLGACAADLNLSIFL